jgi:hypothetical protein
VLNITNFKPSDYSMIQAWWKAANEPCPPIAAMPEESTFVISTNGVPAASISVLLTNTKELCYLENFVSNPELKGARKELTQKIIDHANEYARNLGYKRTLIFSYKDKIKKRYMELGMLHTVSNISAFVKEF